MSSFLQNYQRQPKLFIDLPSKGKFYNDGVLEGGQHVQIPVFGMNAMDEILFKTPDALFSGDATAQVIHSCIPTILDPWKLVGFDIDYVLLAIRIATYGDSITINTKCPHCTDRSESVVSLQRMIQNYENYETDFSFSIKELTFHLKPTTYRQMTEFGIENYSYERTLLQIAQNKDLSDEEKNKQSKLVYQNSSNLNLRIAVSYISNITNGVEQETDAKAITEFVSNNDAEFYNELKNSIYALSNRWKMPNVDIVCGNEECSKQYSTKVELDYSNFFGLKFLHSRNLIS